MVIQGYARYVIFSALIVLMSVLFKDAQTAPVSTGPYSDFSDMYEWLGNHELARRQLPSMRLRFGKRDLPRMWTVSQRSMPSLRLRFGKRVDPQQMDWDDHEIQQRSDNRSPVLRMRFGKRDFGLEDVQERNYLPEIPNEINKE